MCTVVDLTMLIVAQLKKRTKLVNPLGPMELLIELAKLENRIDVMAMGATNEG